MSFSLQSIFSFGQNGKNGKNGIFSDFAVEKAQKIKSVIQSLGDQDARKTFLHGNENIVIPSPTLNVNGTGAKPIVYRGSAISAGYLAANRVYEFVYDGTNYALVGDIDTNTNTTYSAGAGLTLSGTQFKHTNSVTAGTAKGDDSKTLSYGGTFTIPSVTYDAQGHITAKSTTTMTMPAVPSNVASATKLQSARNFSITGGATAAAVSFNGTADVSLNVTSLNAIKLTVADSDTLILDGSI